MKKVNQNLVPPILQEKIGTKYTKQITSKLRSNYNSSRTARPTKHRNLYESYEDDNRIKTKNNNTQILTKIKATLNQSNEHPRMQSQKHNGDDRCRFVLSSKQFISRIKTKFGFSISYSVPIKPIFWQLIESNLLKKENPSIDKPTNQTIVHTFTFCNIQATSIFPLSIKTFISLR